MKYILIFLVSFFSLLHLFSCTKPQEVVLINGAGASFPYLLYSKWLHEYRKIKPKVAINYQSIGSGGGIRQFMRGILDFGATDIPVSAEELKRTNKKIIHIPTTLSAVAVTYNLNIKGKSLQLDGQTLSQIFQGTIKKWNHSKIKKLNPTISLPNKPIVVVYRADGSGTTAFFTEFLSQSSKKFLNKVGKGKSVNWPVGIGGKGNEGVMGLVNKMKGSIAYLSLSYTSSQKLPTIKIKNKAGNFIAPTVQSVKAAANYTLKKQKSFMSSLIYSQEKTSYPISGFTYIILFEVMPERKGRVIVDFLKWALDSGQKYSEELYFVTLPKTIINSAVRNLSQIQYE